MKAVVWADAFQTVVMAVGVIVALIAAAVVAGGPSQVWRIASENGRTQALE